MRDDRVLALGYDGCGCVEKITGARRDGGRSGGGLLEVQRGFKVVETRKRWTSWGTACARPGQGPNPMRRQYKKHTMCSKAEQP